MGINTSNSYSVVLKLDDMRQNRIFVGGETVSGAAIITVSSKCTIPANAMQLILSSKLTYYETKIPQNDNLISKQIFQKYYPLVNSSNQDENVRIEQGINKFPFEIVIPDNLPSQIYCSKSISLISHSLIITIRKKETNEEKPAIKSADELPFPSITNSINLNIVPHVNIISNPTLLQPHTVKFENNSICVEMQFQHTAYVPGQTIDFQLKILNKKMYYVKSCKVSLIQEFVYHKVSGQRTMLQFSPIEAETGARKELNICEHCQLQLPLLPFQPSHSFTTTINNIEYSMSISYRIMLLLKFKGFFMSTVRLDKHIVIGNRPGVHEMARDWVHRMRNSVDTTEINSTQGQQSSSLSNLYPTIDHSTNAPPSYNSIFEEHNASAPPPETEKRPLS